MPVSSKDLSQRLSTRLANFKLDDKIVAKLADRLIIDGLDIRKWDVCIYGICVDYFSDKIPKLDGILSRGDIARIDIFPYGIIEWDRFRVHVSYNVNELEGRSGGLGRQ
jgi:hypothetical protein